jgi:hypothetical protein
VRDALGEANRRHETNVGVSAVILDSERFKISSSNRAINEAITRKYDQIYEVAKEAFPRARVEWYARGLVHKVSEGKWSVVPYFTLQEKGDSVSCQVYEVPSVARMRESCQRTVALAGENGREAVTAWVALGAGFDRSGLRPRWRFNLDYNPAFSWTLGRDINRSLEHGRGATPWDAVKTVVLYPSPLDLRSPLTFTHFLAYARGAVGRPERASEPPPACVGH